MTHTSPLFVFGSNALAIKDDIATIVMSNSAHLQPFADLADLRAEIVPKRYATFEPNHWLLDGNYGFLAASNNKVGFVSTQLSDGSANIGTQPVISFTFNSVHSTTGLRLHFSQISQDYAQAITVRAYNASNAQIYSVVHNPSTYDYTITATISSFKRIDIEFNHTNTPYRFSRLTGIDFDLAARFDGTSIQAATLTEEISPLSLELPSNTLDFTLHSSTGDFSITNPSSVYLALQNKEALDAYEIVDLEMIYLGRFYIEQWESKNENVASFKCFDAIGTSTINNTDFYTVQEAIWNKVAQDVIGEILDTSGFGYTVDASFTGVLIKGMLPILSRRETLQQVAFRLGAYVTCARSNKILIKPFILASSLSAYDFTLTSANKGIVSPVVLLPLVTGIKILASYYQYQTVGKVVFNGNLPTGSFVIRYEPNTYVESASKTSGSGTASYLNSRATFLEITVSVAGSFVITGLLYYTRTTNDVYLNNDSLPAGTPVNIINIDDAPLITDGVATSTFTTSTTVIQRVYDYYLQRYRQDTKLFALNIKVGDRVLIDTQSGKQIKGIVERMSTDLTGGFVSDVSIVGVIV